MNAACDTLPSVTVLLVTYNHETFVSHAIESVMAQVYHGQIRIVVADDASTDRTVAIVAEAAKRRPDVPVTFLPPAPNMGITRNYRRGFATTSPSASAARRWCCCGGSPRAAWPPSPPRSRT
jgi:glycosyltransferase involved in cell wall biosynthesis